MTSRVTWAFMLASIVPLSYIYLSFLHWFYQNPRFYPDTTVEMIILNTQVARLLLVMVVPRFRRARFLWVLDVFTLEIIAFPIFILLSVAYGGTYYLGIAGQIIWAWPTAFMIAFLPFAVYKLASKMRQQPTLSATIPSVAAIFASLTFLASATTSYTQFDGLMGVSKLLLAAVFGSILTPSIPYEVSAAGVALYLVMIVYAVSQGSNAPPNRNGVLVFAVVGTVAAIGWELAANSFTSSDLWVFGAPALALVGVIWGVARAR
ncbi:MAG: hypothetical protein OK449_08140 [Thaumarchaeota archaeon]|nr:hypothetical protein [Nitrososphaerota archaeon]